MGFWGTFGKALGFAAPFIAAPFTGGLSLLGSTALGSSAIGAGIGAGAGALSGGGLKGTLMGAGMGAIPGIGGAIGGKMNGIGGAMGKIGGALGGWGNVATAGIGAGLGALGNRKTGAEKSMEGMLGQYSGLSNMIGQYAKNQHTMAQPALQKAMQYYTTLASGNRSQMGAAMAPQMAALTDTYKGAQRSIEGSQVGAGRDRALAELSQQKAGQMGLMPMQARTGAMDKLGNMGMDLNNNVMNAYHAMGSNLYGQGAIYSQLAGMQRERNQGWSQMGQNLGNIFLPYLLGKKGGKPPTTVPGERSNTSPYPQLPSYPGMY